MAADFTDALRAWDTATAHTRPGHTTIPVAIGDTQIRISEGQAARLADLLDEDADAERAGATPEDIQSHLRDR